MLCLTLMVLLGLCLREATAQTTFCTLHDSTPVFSSPHVEAHVSTVLATDTCFLGEIYGDWVRNLELKEGYVHGKTVNNKRTRPNDLRQTTHTADAPHAPTVRSRGVKEEDGAILEETSHLEGKRFLMGEGTWTQWSSWSECDDAACNVEGTRNRTRKCFVLNPNVQANCNGGESIQLQNCIKSCFVPCSGGFGWTQWHDCTKPCNGTTTRFGYCLNGTANVTTTQEKNCTRDLCPVDGTWSEWGTWSSCSTTVNLAQGIRFRYRQCQPINRHGGADCPGIDFNSGTCIGSEWDEWGPWTNCRSTHCSKGVSLRIRECKKQNCTGDDHEEKECYATHCPINGNWGAWEGWSVCYCNGFRHRTRMCDSPPTMNGGMNCTEWSFDVSACNRTHNTNCPVDGRWTDWSAWNTCSVSCGNGYQSRNRNCTSPPPAYGGKGCGPDDIMVRNCSTSVPCPVDGGWSTWSDWSACSATCQATGLQHRNRSCDSPPTEYGGKTCTGDVGESRICTGSGACPVDGGYSDWIQWTACSASCYGGVMVRSRFCNQPKPQAGGRDCFVLGKSSEALTCNMQPCPVDGYWGLWSHWSKCDVTCGHGTRARDRPCVGTANGGQNCSGNALQTEACNQVVCPVDGAWGQWAGWSGCNCNNTQTRVRKCDSPAPIGSGQQCPGSSRDTMSCTEKPTTCPVDGQWGSWYPWSVCSTTCGSGETLRLRSCSNPRPQNGGLYCDSHEETEEGRMGCQGPPCPINGSWSIWNMWATCSVTCGIGSHSRNRSCDHPAPEHGGEDCAGSDSENRNCTMNPCPVDGSWSGWSPWSVCDVTCSTGTRNRIRTCDSPAPKHGGQPCNGDADQFEQCQEKPCPVDGMWEAWQTWTSCSVTCLNGTRSRTRLCNSPVPQYGGSDCVGQQNGTETCTPRANCDVDGGWSVWSLWSVCSASCAIGHYTRYRNCDNPVPEHFGKFCEGDDRDVATCFRKPCPIDGGFGSWLAWGSCFPSAGNGLKTRTRVCNKPQPLYGGRNCQGNYTENLPCCDSDCPVDGGWSQWSTWSDCPADSNANTTKSRTRSCSQPFPFYGGDNCTGESVESTCCQVNGGWTSWYAWSMCEGDCATAHRDRNRQCSNPRPSCDGKYCVGSGHELDHTCIPDNCATIATAAMTTATSTGTPDTTAAATTIIGAISAATTTASATEITSGATVTTTGVTQLLTSTTPLAAGTTAISTVHPNHQIACTFDVPLNCAWHNVEMLDDMDWIVFNGSTQTDDTGPSSDHTFGNRTGQYIYLESSAPSRQCDKAWYQSAIIQPGVNAPVCFQFWYHMYGADTGSLNIYMASGPQLPKQLLWTVSGNQGDVWMSGHVPLSFTSSFSIIAEATVGNGFRGDIGLDDLMFTQATCSLYPSTAHTQSTATCSATTISPYTGIWTAWFNGQCSVTCGNGTLTRVRHCSTGHAEDCAGNSSEVAKCQKTPCTVNGVWSLWSPWSPCDVTCEDGHIHRTRTCTDPAPAFGGLNCSGVHQETNTCSRAKCPAWSAWFNGQCSVTCGNGTLTRVRHCSTGHAEDCAGNSREVIDCQKSQCKVNGVWSSWSPWSQCDVTCENGHIYRTRTCSNPAPAFGGLNCSEESQETSACSLAGCPVDGSWSSWSPWSQCDVTCEDGHIHRTRTCTNPAPAFGGLNCSGASQEINTCKLAKCPSWSEWFLSDCSVTCGDGTQSRMRICSSGHDEDCPGSALDTIPCSQAPC